MEKQLNSQESHLEDLKNLKGVKVLNTEEEIRILGGEGEDSPVVFPAPVEDDPNNPNSKWVFGKPGTG